MPAGNISQRAAITASSGTLCLRTIPYFILFTRKKELIDNLTLPVAPRQPVGCALKGHHSKPVFTGGTCGIAGDDNGIADLQCVSVDAASGQLGATCPFNGPSLHLSVCVGSFDVNE